MKKYELTSEVIEYQGHTLHRIKALKDFDSVEEGQFGGWIENEKNLSQYDNAWIYGDAMAFDNANVFGNAKVCDYAKVYGNVEILDNAIVYGNAIVHGNAKIYDYAKVHDEANIYDFAEVYGNVRIRGNATIRGDAKVHNDYDYIVFKNFWSSGRYFTWTRSNNKWSVGCFYGTGGELIEKAYNDSEISGKEYERVVRYVESILIDKKIKDTLSNKNGKTC